MTAELSTAISAVCSVLSLIAIFLLMKEHIEKRRPYLQVTFELVRSSLVCLVIRNVGDVPAKLKGVLFNPSFVEQLPLNAREKAKSRNGLNISIYPGTKWILCLEVIASTAINYQNTRLEVTLLYTKKGKRKVYEEPETVEFRDYSGFLVYISEIDELTEAIRKSNDKFEIIGTALTQLVNDNAPDRRICKYANLSDDAKRTIITGGEEPIILERTVDNQNSEDNKNK